MSTFFVVGLNIAEIKLLSRHNGKLLYVYCIGFRLTSPCLMERNHEVSSTFTQKILNLIGILLLLQKLLDTKA